MQSLPPAPSDSLILSGLIVAEITAGFETTMVLTALVKMTALFGDATSVGWIVTGYMLVSTAICAIGARLGDIYGRRRILFVVLSLAVAGSLISAATTQLAWIIAGRCMQGAAGAILPLCYGLAREHLAPARISRSIGWLSATASLSSALGLVLGGLIVDSLGWHYIFFASATTGLVSILVVALTVPRGRSSKPQGQLDILGAILLATGIASLLLALSTLSRSGGTAGAAVLAIMGVAMLTYWLRHELRHPYPLIDVRLLRVPRILGGNLCLALIGVGALQPQFVLFLLQQPAWTGIGLGVSATVASFVKAPAQVIGGAASLLGGRFAKWIEGEQLLVWGTGLIVVGAAMMALQHDATWSIFVSYGIMGAGVGVVMTASPLLIVAAAPADRTSEATGLASVARSLGTAIGAQIFAVILTTSKVVDPARGPGSYPAPDAYALGFVFMITVGSIAWLSAVMIARAAHRSA